jgi:hypothetical protein
MSDGNVFDHTDLGEPSHASMPSSEEFATPGRIGNEARAGWRQLPKETEEKVYEGPDAVRDAARDLGRELHALWQSNLVLRSSAFQRMDALRVIARMHDKFQMPSPVACASVRAILELSMDEKPPRSWKRDEQEQWAYLPAEIRFALSRRQRDFDKEIRRCQNETADLRKKVNAEKQEQIIKSLERPVEQDHPTSP